jgi:hypothetical protein
MYEGVSKSSWTESITKCKVTFVTGNCYPLKVVIFQVYWMGEGFHYCWKHFLELHTGQSVIATEFQECHTNHSLIAVISFLETR